MSHVSLLMLAVCAFSAVSGAFTDWSDPYPWPETRPGFDDLTFPQTKAPRRKPAFRQTIHYDVDQQKFMVTSHTGNLVETVDAVFDLERNIAGFSLPNLRRCYILRAVNLRNEDNEDNEGGVEGEDNEEGLEGEGDEEGLEGEGDEEGLEGQGDEEGLEGEGDEEDLEGEGGEDLEGEGLEAELEVEGSEEGLEGESSEESLEGVSSEESLEGESSEDDLEFEGDEEVLGGGVGEEAIVVEEEVMDDDGEEADVFVVRRGRPLRNRALLPAELREECAHWPVFWAHRQPLVPAQLPEQAQGRFVHLHLNGCVRVWFKTICLQIN